MSRLEDLSPDLRAVLSLLVGRRKRYAEIAGTLHIDERNVHDRAHAALALLAPRQARALSPAQREQVGEYLLGQTDAAQSEQTRAYLTGSGPGRAWAQALTAELAPLATAALPEIPPDAPAEPPASSTRTERAPSSRRGGAIVLGALAAVVVIAVVLIVSLGGGSSPSSATTSTTTNAGGSAPNTASSPAASPTGTSTTSSSGSGKPSKSGKSSREPHLEATLPLTPPSSSSKALGLVEVISEGGEHAFILAAEHLPPTNGFHYAAWLYNTPTDAYFLGGGTTVGANGVLKAAQGLPPNASRYATIVLTEEHEARPKQPGPIVLSGAFKL